MRDVTSPSAADIFNKFVVRLFSLRPDQVLLATVEVSQFIWRLYKAYKIERTFSGKVRLFMRGLRGPQTSWLLGLLREVAALDPRASLAIKALEKLQVIPGLSMFETVEEVLSDLPRVLRRVRAALAVNDDAELGPGAHATPCVPLTGYQQAA